MARMKVLTIDTGTTNTRIRIVEDGSVLAGKWNINVGARDTAITGSNQNLRKAIRNLINQALNETSLTEGEIDLVIASGMITSEVGLVEIPHVMAPAGIEELALSVREVLIPDVFPKPIHFIPGVKNALSTVDWSNCEKMDIMRGEEVETLGILKQTGLHGPLIMVLPGSHTKFVSVDDHNRITGCMTTLTGELISAIAHNTILARSISDSLVTDVCEDAIQLGANLANRVGISRLCFCIRVMDQFLGLKGNIAANFLAGAMAATDIYALSNTETLGVTLDHALVIGGPQPLRRIFKILLSNSPNPGRRIVEVDDHIVDKATAVGAFMIATHKSSMPS